MRQRAARYRRSAPALLALACVAGGLAAGCSSAAQPTGTNSTFSGAARPAGSWADPNGNLANTRDAVASVISSSNVASLKEAWAFKLSGTAAKSVSYAGSFAANPIVVNGVVYLQDLYANVYAISLGTGKLKWEYQANLEEKSGPGPDGVAVVNGVVYGDTSTAVFALNAATGAVIWDDKSLLNSGQGAFEIQPAVAAGRVYLASAYGSGPGGGVLLALDAATGKLRWYYQAVPNDFKDYDLQLSPIAATVHGVPAIIAGGKMGDVYAFNAATGALLWKTPVGVARPPSRTTWSSPRCTPANCSP